MKWMKRSKLQRTRSQRALSAPLSVIASNYPPSGEQPCPTFSQTERQLPLLNATLVSSQCVLSLRTDQCHELSLLAKNLSGLLFHNESQEIDSLLQTYRRLLGREGEPITWVCSAETQPLHLTGSAESSQALGMSLDTDKSGGLISSSEVSGIKASELKVPAALLWK